MAKDPLSNYRVISVDEAEERFSELGAIEYPYAEFADEQEIRLYEGDLRVSTMASPDDVDWVPFNTIVDGDLIVDGVFDWHDDNSGNFVVVTGSVRVENMTLCGCPNVYIGGDLDVAGTLLAYYGDDGGVLTVNGATRATTIINTYYFNMQFSAKPDALLISDDYRIDCEIDFSDDEVGRLLLPEFLDDDTINVGELAPAVQEGRPFLRPDVKTVARMTAELLDELLARRETVTELDLSERRLTSVPGAVFELTNLTRLSLANNPIEDIPADIARLSKLEYLNLGSTSITELPDAIGSLTALRRLELEGAPRLERLPDAIGDLPELTALDVSMTNCELPESLARASKLSELDMSYWHRHDEPRPFPTIITRLTGLEVLDLSMTRFTSLPEAITNLTRLRELRLDAALAYIPDLAPLTRMPSLRKLHLDGRVGTGYDYPSFDILDPIWTMSWLEDVSVDRYSGETRWDHETNDYIRVRHQLTRLPDEIFATMTNLRRLDLSFIDLQTLPESLYRLPNLEFVNLEYTKLDRPTVERLGVDLAHVKLDLRNVTPRYDQSDPNWQEVHRLVKEGASDLTSNDARAAELLEKAVALCTDTASHSSYDELYAYYGLIHAYGRLANTTDSDERARIVVRAVEVSRKVLDDLVPPPGSIMHFTDEGAFQEEATRQAANALGWYAMKEGRLDEALAELEPGLTVATREEHGYIFDTKVRILLKMGRSDEAYLIVDQILAKNPDFEDFQDLRYDEGFLAWKSA